MTWQEIGRMCGSVCSCPHPGSLDAVPPFAYVPPPWSTWCSCQTPCLRLLMPAGWSHGYHDLHGQSRLTDRDEGRYTLSHTRPMSCHITSLPWQEREEELNKLLLTKVSDRDRNVKVNIKLLGRIAFVAQRPIVIKLSRERSVGRSVGRSSGGFNGRPHMQWPTRPQHIGPLEALRVVAL